MLAAYAAEQAEQAKARAADSDFLPKVFLSASTSHTSGRSSITAVPAIGQQAGTVNLDGSRSGSSVFLGVTLPLYDGGLRAAARMQARNDAASAGERLTCAKQDATRQIVAAPQCVLRSGIAANEAAVALLKAARVTYDAASAAYRNGVGSLTDATLAQSQMLVAQNAYADSIANARSAAAVLAVATGRCRCWTNARRRGRWSAPLARRQPAAPRIGSFRPRRATRHACPRHLRSQSVRDAPPSCISSSRA